MKRNLLLGIILIGAMALSSCSVNKTASNQKNSDDVYFSKATAAEEPEYVAQKPAYRQDVDEEQYDNDDDYYNYDDYSTRINRFAYYSPFSYYDSYYGYSPYNYGGFSLGLGFGLGYGGYGSIGYGYGAFSPYAGFGYGGFGYGGFGYGGYGYSPYSYFGIGYGGSPYWGVYSAYNSGPSRPYRGNGNPRGGVAGGRAGVGYSGVANNGIGYYPARPGRTVNRTYGNGGYSNGGYATRGARPTRGNNGQTYQPQQTQQRPSSVDRQPSYSPAPSSSGGGSRGSSGGGGGGGGRPSRP